ncbi:MAG: superoxide dismutase family protein [Planctomycetes bacterium]|nr:superoxide dismutase family protein [Planctomycetota bacterium]
MASIRTFHLWGFCAAVVLALGGCKAHECCLARSRKSEPSAVPVPAGVARAVSVLQPTQGNAVKGTVTFEKAANGVKVVADVEGLTPGPHGFHIHLHGDCSAPDASSAGGHFNPENMPHGGPDDAQRHVGDLGNLVADAAGRAHLERVDAHLALEGPHSILGRSVIVHAKADDLKTQPTGDAGGRVACGLIGAAKE